MRRRVRGGWEKRIEVGERYKVRETRGVRGSRERRVYGKERRVEDAYRRETTGERG